MKRMIFLLLAVISIFSMSITLSACSASEKEVTITFDHNYKNSPENRKNKISPGSRAERPENPTRAGYVFIGWYMDKNSVDIFDFNERISDDITIYAGWLSENSEAVAKYMETAFADLNIRFADGDSADSVTEDVALPDTINELPLVWVSDDQNIVTDKGKVIRPKDANVNVTLTAGIRIGNTSKEKTFSLLVIKEKDYIIDNVKDLSLEEVKNRNRSSKDSFEIAYDEKLQNVTSILGNYSEYRIESKEDALWAIGNVRTLIGIEDPIEELYAVSHNSDKFGSTYIFNQRIDGIEVYGRTVTVTADPMGEAVGLGSSIIDDKAIDVTVSVTEEEVREKLCTEDESGFMIQAVEKVIFSLYEYADDPIMAFKVTTDTEEIFLSAKDGREILRFSRIHTDKSVTGIGKNERKEKISFPVEYKTWDWLFYYMMDRTRNVIMYKDQLFLPNTRIGSEFNIWRDETAISAYTNMITVYDWWKTNFDRNSLDDNGMAVKVIVHDNAMSDNAYWSSHDLSMHFCDNDSIQADVSTAGALDVTAHEYTHGVIRFITAALPYHNAAGAIEEAYADIFGCFVDGNWTIGEDWMVVRNIADPNDTLQPAGLYDSYYIDYTINSFDHGGVHTNSTVISHAAYLMAMKGIGQTELQDLWYLSLRQGYDAASDFYSVRRNVLKAARMLEFPDDHIRIVEQSFDEVNIGSSQTISKASDTILVLDVSESMQGRPLEEMKKTAIQICNTLLSDEGENRVGVVFYDNRIITVDLTDEPELLVSQIEAMEASGGTDMEVGLRAADEMFRSLSKGRTTKNVVIMSAGIPTEGKTSDSGAMPDSSYSAHDRLVSYANAVIDTAEGMMIYSRMYSLGFFQGLDDDEKEFALALMKELTNQMEGCHQIDKAPTDF